MPQRERLSLMERAYRLKEWYTENAKTSSGSSRCDEVWFAEGYAEPGYPDPKGGVIAFGNWNDIADYSRGVNERRLLDDAPARLGHVLEAIGVELEWSDEWVQCEECGLAFRTSPDSYSWQQSGTLDDGCCVCADCIDGAEHLENLEGQHRRCNTIESINPEDHGYRCIPIDYEHGLHGGQDASPEKIADVLRSVGCRRFVFNLDSSGQFDVRFSVWLHEEEADKFDAAVRALQTTPTRLDLDPAEGMRRALKNAPVIPADPNGGIVYTKIDATTGTSTTRIVSPEEFIAGIKD